MQKILYLDDSKELLEVISEYLHAYNYLVETTESPISALQLLNNPKNNYHAVLVDYSMPDMNGIEFLTILNSENLLDKFRVALFSSMAKEETILQNLKKRLPNDYNKIGMLEKMPDSKSRLGLLEFLGTEISKVQLDKV